MAFSQKGAWPETAFAHFAVLALSVTCGDSSPKGGASGETAHFAFEPETFPLCQGLSLWERWICEAKTERARQLSPRRRFQGERGAAKPVTLRFYRKLSRPAKASLFGRGGFAKQRRRGLARCPRAAASNGSRRGRCRSPSKPLPVKMQCRTARRLSGIALSKIFFPLNMARA